MTAPESKFDAELAWDLQEWTRKVAPHHLDRDECRDLAAFLTEKGYHKGEKGLRASLAYLEEVGATLADEFLPVFEVLKKKRER